MLRHLLLLIAMPAMMAASAADYSTIAEKATRFYADGDWAGASAMYSLLIDERPDDPGLYAHAIVADGMRGDSLAQMALMRGAIAHHVPFDSVFSAVETCSFAQGRADIYEGFLLSLRRAEPWLQRTVDARLLRYYAFRRYPAETERYAGIMLRGLPDNEDYLYLLAGAYVTAGDMAKAEEVYKRIVSLNPRAYVALLYLGNRAADTGDTVAAIDYLRRASAIKATPYVVRRLAALSR